MTNHDNRKNFHISFSFIFYSVLDGFLLGSLYLLLHHFSINSNLILATIFISRLIARCWNFIERLNFPENQTRKPIYPRLWNHFASLVQEIIIVIPIWLIINWVLFYKNSQWTLSHLDLVTIVFCVITEVMLIGVETYRLDNISEHLHNNWIEIDFVRFMIDFKKFKAKVFIIPNLFLLIFFIWCISLNPFLSVFMIIYLFRIIIAAYRLLTPEVCYLDVDSQKFISQQFGLPSDALHRKSIGFSQFEHSFQDITEVEILTHKQAIKEYENYLKYYYRINKKTWNNVVSNQCEAMKNTFLTVQRDSYNPDFYKICLKLSLEGSEFYLPLTYLYYENMSELYKITRQLKSIVFR